MKELDHNVHRERLFLEPDGELGARESAELERHLASCGECARERRDVARLVTELDAARVPVAPDFAARVMGSLPAAPWESRPPAAWRPAAVVVLLLLGGAVALGRAAGPDDPARSLAATAIAVFELLRSALVAGAGLLGASWRGLGLGVAEILDASPLTWIAFAVLVLGIDVLLVRAIVRRRRARAAELGRGGGRDSS